MRAAVLTSAVLASAVLTSGLVAAGCRRAPPPSSDEPPAWAYPVPPKDWALPPDDGGAARVPDSALTLRFAQTRDPFFAPDWHPDDHSPMPPIVSRGRAPDVLACGYCHRADGPGGPENASLAGLPAPYIAQQMSDFANGLRRNPVPARAPSALMIKSAAAATPAEIAEAAAYFAAQRPRANLRVVEADSIPEVVLAGWTFAEAKSGRTEPLGARIVEVPEDPETFEARDARARFVAYVPPGSVARGRALAADGGGAKTVPCASCHGADLRGVGPIPRIAGRSPSYVVRQLRDIKSGARAGASAATMLPVVRNLGLDEMIALAAYLALLPP